MKNKIDWRTPLDKIIESKWGEISESNNEIRIKAEKVLIRSIAVSCYAENTPDWTKARNNLATAKYNLLCAIKEYDDLLAEAKRLLKQDGERVTTINYAVETLLTSHEIVEYVCSDYYKKG